ncbi:MAG: methyltransferase family protein [Dehalococcoidia bacterium]
MAVSAVSGPFTRSAWKRRLGLLQDATLVCVSAVFFYLHAAKTLDGDLTNVAFAAEQGLLVFMFLTRRRSLATSTRPFDWLVAAGAWLPLLMRPIASDGPLAQAGTMVQVAGLGLACVGFVYLGRSFGVVAANRGLKTAGPYRLVRHPIYFAHTVTLVGFCLANPSPWNLGLFALTLACQLLRIRAEEKVLSDTASYAEYRAQVRWRLIPGLY